MYKGLNVLVIINQQQFPLRATVRDSIFCFEKYSDANIYYLNTAKLNRLPGYIKKIKFHVVIFHTVFMSFRWGGEKEYNRLSKLLDYFKTIDSIKVANPQDEWIHTLLLNRFINDFRINVVFSVAAETEWKIIYDNVNHDTTKFFRILTGYIDDNVIKYIDKKNSVSDRPIDIGYRAYKSPPWLGKHGFLKTLVANKIEAFAKETTLVTDISTDEKDVFTGNKWYDFLTTCKYFIGVEGGSSVLDKDGQIWQNGLNFLKENPNADYELVEKNVFPGAEGTINLIALSPRHLECCISKTCQILIEGSYNDILIANRHYISLKRDFSNISEVFELIQNDTERERITNNAYNEIVLSKKYSYQSFVAFFFESIELTGTHELTVEPYRLFYNRISFRFQNLYNFFISQFFSVYYYFKKYFKLIVVK